jgi:hypothetical protein
VPVLRRLLDEVVDGVADLGVGASVCVREICESNAKDGCEQASGAPDDPRLGDNVVVGLR